MLYIDSLIKDGLSQGNLRLVQRCIVGLGMVGFYYPQTVFQTLRLVFAGRKINTLESALIRCLSTIRVLYLDEVDIFLR